MGGTYVEGSYWFYAPNKGAPIAWATFFAISCVIHVWQCFHYKCWKFTGMLACAAFIFVAGYVLREVGAYHYNNLVVFIISTVMLYAAPPLYELSNYFTLSRILYYVPYYSPIHPGRVFVTFTALSAIVEALNGRGAAIFANSSLSKKEQDVGKALLKSALIMQLGILCCFLSIAGYFHLQCKKAGLLPKNLKAVLLTMYVSSALIGTRTIYRTVEYFSIASLHITENFDTSTISPIVRYEWYFWVFEALLMITNSILLNVRHPMRFLPRNNKIYLAQDGFTEIEGPGYEDGRKYWITIIDPFDLWGMVKGRNMRKKFWDTHQQAGGERDAVAGEMNALQ